MTRQKMTMQPGKKYRGWGFINEYGEVHFEASQPDDNPRRMRLVHTNESCSIYESGDHFRIAIKIRKSSERMDMVRDFLDKIQIAATDITKYI